MYHHNLSMDVDYFHNAVVFFQISKKFSVALNVHMSLIKSLGILNYDESESTLPEYDLISNTNKHKYIVSDADEEILILIEFKSPIPLKEIVINASPIDENKDEDSDDLDISPPKEVDIYKTANLSIDFNDLSSMTPDVSIQCKSKKLNKGQAIKLQKSSKNAIKFKSVQYLVIHIKSNQNDTEQTYLNGIKLKMKQNEISKASINEFSTKFPFDKTDTKNVQKSREYFAAILQNGMCHFCHFQISLQKSETILIYICWKC